MTGLETSDVEGGMKTNPWFVKSASGAGTFTVFRWYPSCVEGWGNITSWSSLANDNVVIVGPPSYLRVTNSTCIIDPYYLRLQRGNGTGSPGSVGPWYLIKPDFGPSMSVRKMLKVQVKHVGLMPVGDTYNKSFLYDPVANDWTWAVDATNSYNIEEIAPGALTACETRN